MKTYAMHHIAIHLYFMTYVIVTSAGLAGVRVGFRDCNTDSGENSQATVSAFIDAKDRSRDKA